MLAGSGILNIVTRWTTIVPDACGDCWTRYLQLSERDRGIENVSLLNVDCVVVFLTNPAV